MGSINQLRAGSKAAIAAALTQVEQSLDSGASRKLLDDACKNDYGQVIGITGPPGVGKSTLIGTLIRQLPMPTGGSGRGASKSSIADRGGLAHKKSAAANRVGVLAVDPSSQVSGGALLGDRIRFQTDPKDDGVFVRSSAAGRQLGGVAASTQAAATLMRALYPWVIVETIGVGQSEIDISLIADTVIFCVQPASGDSLQFLKSGIAEIPDIICVTKADYGAVAKQSLADMRAALRLHLSEQGWNVPVILISAPNNHGVDTLIETCRDHWNWLGLESRLRAKRYQRETAWVYQTVLDRYGRRGIERACLSESEANLAWPEGDNAFAHLRRISAALENH